MSMSMENIVEVLSRNQLEVLNYLSTIIFSSGLNKLNFTLTSQVISGIQAIIVYFGKPIQKYE